MLSPKPAKKSSRRTPSAELRTFAPSGTDTICDINLESETPVPVGLFLNEDVRMLTQTPGKDARPRAGETSSWLKPSQF